MQFVNLHVNCKFLWKGYTYVPVYQFYLILVVNVNVNVNFKFLIRNVFRFRNADFLYISCFSFVKDDALIPDAQVYVCTYTCDKQGPFVYNVINK